MFVKYSDLNSLNEDENYFEEVSPNIWLMDDHKWSYYIWELVLRKRKSVKVPLSLYHLDYHWDGINDFNKEDIIRLKEEGNLEYIYEITRKNNLIRKDSFIAPTIISGIVDKVHFYCFQCDEEAGLDEQFLKEWNAEQHIHKTDESLVTAKKNYDSIIFNLDLDLFNKSNDMMYEGEIWSETEIKQLVDKCSNLIKSSAVITIAMSFGYSGTKENTKDLVKLVIPRIIKHSKF